MATEERVIYPIVGKRVGHEDQQEAESEHELVRDGISKLEQCVDQPGFAAAVAMVAAGIKHHVKEEEREVFPRLKASLDRSELAELGDQVAALKKPTRRRAR